MRIGVVVLLLTLTFVDGSYIPEHPANFTANTISSSVNPSDPYEDIYYDDSEISGQESERLTEENVKLLVIRELVTFITGKENAAIVNDITQREEDRKRNCSIKYGPYYYYDRVIGDCRNCVDRDCHKNEICAWECRDLLKLKILEEDLEATKQELRNIENKVTGMQNGNVSFIVWNTLLTICMVIIFVAIGFLLHRYKYLQHKSSMKAVVAQYDADGEKLIPVVQDSASTLVS